MLARKRTGLATSCVFDCHIGPNIFTSQICILHLRIRIASSHPHRIFAPSHLRSSHLRLFISYIFISAHGRISDLRRICALSHLRSSYAISLSSSGLHILKPHLVFTILGLHDVVTLSYLIKIFKISLSYIYNLIYLRLQNLISLNIISPLSGQPSSSLSCYEYIFHAVTLTRAAELGVAMTVLEVIQLEIYSSRRQYTLRFIFDPSMATPLPELIAGTEENSLILWVGLSPSQYEELERTSKATPDQYSERFGLREEVQAVGESPLFHDLGRTT